MELRGQVLLEKTRIIRKGVRAEVQMNDANLKWNSWKFEVCKSSEYGFPHHSKMKVFALRIPCFSVVLFYTSGKANVSALRPWVPHYSLTHKSFSTIHINIRGHDATLMIIIIILKHNQNIVRNIFLWKCIKIMFTEF